MIGTHAPKLLNPRIKQQALRAWLPADVPAALVCSRNIKMRRELWALPSNAADMGAERKLIAERRLPTEPEIPSVTDDGVKQVLLPTGPVGSDSYVCAAPVYSCGLVHELYQRLKERNLPFVSWTIQPTPAALSNHGEALLMQAGRLRMLRRGVHNRLPVPSIPCDGIFEQTLPVAEFFGGVVQLSGNAQQMNIGSGGIATGMPAITAIGGAVHAIERECGIDVDFAIGYEFIEWGERARKAVEMRRGAAHKASTPGYIADEIQGSGRFVLLLRPRDPGADVERLADAACTLRRLAGGAVFDERVDVLLPGDAPSSATWIADASRVMDGADALDAALDLYGHGGEWVDGGWRQPDTTYTLNMSGYAYLSDPAPAAWARQAYPACWVEPVFSCVSQSLRPSWWRRQSAAWGVSWLGAQPPL
ncbi:MAG: hypothetical protein BGO66_03010 [Alicycliphilus sp. 69-12]|nr:MAG: hypothetical protein BGO66_03010 [Alicycliphilus sp. 69-12]